ncbi:MAG: complex I subunit 5 family protein [Eubacteriales bacterium]
MNELFILIPVFLPIVGGAVMYFLPFRKDAHRNIFSFLLLLFCAVFVWLLAFMTPESSLVLIKFTPTLSFALFPDGAGKIFSCLSASLWPVTAIYAFGYMKKEEHLPVFWTFFTMSFGVTMGIAMAENILTMYLFYELLTLFTIPLIMHGRREKNIVATKKYMLYSFGGAAFAFAGVAFLIISGAGEFSLGGSFAGTDNNALATTMFVFAFFGFGVKAAVFPFCGWLPAASVAPTPVTALLHAVAVVKAGAFAIIRLIYYSYGTDFLYGSTAQYIAIVFSLLTILYGSSMAVKQRHFKRRLAYSTIANLSYIVFAASLMTPEGLSASFLHIIFHSVTKICLFFCAGEVLFRTEKEYVPELEGMGKKMPLTFAFYTVSALSLTGVPPLCGFMSKWKISQSAIQTGSYIAVIGVAVLLISALLTAIYSLTVTVKAFFPEKGAEVCASYRKAELSMTIATGICASLTLVLGFFSREITEMISKVVGI